VNIFGIMKIVAAVAQALADGKITRDEAKAIVALIVDMFLPEALEKK